MKGLYVVRENGREIARSENIITTAGKRIIAGYLAGFIPSWSGTMGIGVGDAAAAVGDLYLDFEAGRIPVSARSVAYGGGAGGAHRVVVKGELTEDVAGIFWELGIFSGNSDTGAVGGTSKTITIADSSEDWSEYDGANWIDIASTPNTTSSRFGADAVTLTVGATSKKYRITDLSLDLSENRPNDKFQFLTRVISGSLSSAIVRFKTDDSNYYSYTTPSFASGTYASVEYNKSLWTATGTPQWADINIFEIEISSGSSVEMILDGVRVQEYTPVDDESVLVSRTVLSVPIIKAAGSRMDIEYYLDI